MNSEEARGRLTVISVYVDHALTASAPDGQTVGQEPPQSTPPSSLSSTRLVHVPRILGITGIGVGLMLVLRLGVGVGSRFVLGLILGVVLLRVLGVVLGVVSGVVLGVVLGVELGVGPWLGLRLGVVVGVGVGSPTAQMGWEYKSAAPVALLLK